MCIRDSIGSADIELQYAQACLLDVPGHAHRGIEIGENDARDRVGVERPRVAVHLHGLFQPLIEWLRGQTGATCHEGRSGRVWSPRDRVPVCVEEHVFGALQLVACGVRFIHRFDHDRADAGFQGPSDAVGLDQMLRRAGDERILQGHAAEGRGEGGHFQFRPFFLPRAGRLAPLDHGFLGTGMA